jgi:hypothetical protein
VNAVCTCAECTEAEGRRTTERIFAEADARLHRRQRKLRRRFIEQLHGRRGTDDKHVITAVRLLEAHGYQAPDLTRLRVVTSLNGLEGCCSVRSRDISIARDSESYRMAVDGNVTALGGVLLHELVHLDGHDDERAPLDAELAFLRAAKAPTEWIQVIERLADRQGQN